MLITDVQLAGNTRLLDVRCAAGRIAEVGPSLRRRKDEPVLAGAGGALLPGLHDHHIHLYALAASCDSVQCGPPAVANRAQLQQALRAADGTGWLRGVAYHETVAGDLDRQQLDQIRSDRPLKIQHRSGTLWMVNSRAAAMLSLDEHAGLPGIELDAAGRPNGRLFRLDGWVREQLVTSERVSVPSLARVSRRLASFGVTGVTDATPDNNGFTMAQFASAARRGELLQSLRVMGGEELPDVNCAQVLPGERKVMLDADALPDWDVLRSVFAHAHGAGRAVAVHCVTPAELVLTLAVLRDVGLHPGDRIEHASLVPHHLLPLLSEVGVRVVTQPGFIYERGAQYLQAVPRAEHSELYRCHTLLAHGIPLAGSTDAPYGDPDPWAAIRAAVARRSRTGVPLGLQERLTPEQALALFTSAADDPGGSSRAVGVGAAADLCLLQCSWQEARKRLSSADVRATLRAGQLIHQRGYLSMRRPDAAAIA